MRPEMTPTVARMIAARERHYKKPINGIRSRSCSVMSVSKKAGCGNFQFNADIFVK